MRGGVGVVTIDGPIRELTLDVVDICRKGITSPSGQSGICFRTSPAFRPAEAVAVAVPADLWPLNREFDVVRRLWQS